MTTHQTAVAQTPAPGLATDPGITIIAVLYHIAHVVHTVAFCRAVGRALQAAGCQVETVFVCNNTGLRFSIRTHELVINGSNEAQEFSAYQQGLCVARTRGKQGGLLFLNDTVLAHHQYSRSTLRRLRLLALRSNRSEQPQVVGPVDDREASFQLRGTPLHRWVSTHLFFLNAAAVRVLDHSLYDKGLDELVRGGGQEQRFFSPNVHPSHAKLLADWLFGGTAQGAWYKAQPLSEATCAFMAMKARCILREHDLARRLECANVRFIEFRPRSVAQRVLAKAEGWLARLFTWKRSAQGAPRAQSRSSASASAKASGKAGAA